MLLRLCQSRATALSKPLCSVRSTSTLSLHKKRRYLPRVFRMSAQVDLVLSQDPSSSAQLESSHEVSEQHSSIVQQSTRMEDLETPAASAESMVLLEVALERPEEPSSSAQSTGQLEPSLEVSHETKPLTHTVYNIYSWQKYSPKTRLVYIRDLLTAELEVARLSPGPLGFDCEWKPTYEKGRSENPVALVQLASETTILLIQVSFMRAFPQKLREVLQDSRYIKAGVGIQGDCKKLWANYQVITRNCVDLALMARTVDNARWKGKYTDPIGLARLCETYEDFTLNKGKITRSNWEAILRDAQLEYAANDCHSGLVLYKKLSALMSAMTPRPLPVYYSFDLVEGYAYQPSVEPVLWHPFNPLYDPGPPPPPRDPKKQKERKGKSKDVDGAGPAAGAARSPPRATVHLPPPGISHPYNAYARLGVPVAGPSARGGRFARGRGYPPSQQQRNVESNASAATNGFVPQPPSNPASPKQHSRGSYGMNRRGGRGGGRWFRGGRGGGPRPVSP